MLSMRSAEIYQWVMQRKFTRKHLCMSYRLLDYTQKPITVMYKGQLNVGSFIADIVVEDCIILELKATSMISKEHTAQLINYLTCTGKDVGYILNFGGDRRFERRLGPSALHSNAK